MSLKRAKSIIVCLERNNPLKATELFCESMNRVLDKKLSVQRRVVAEGLLEDANDVINRDKICQQEEAGISEDVADALEKMMDCMDAGDDFEAALDKASETGDVSKAELEDAYTNLDLDEEIMISMYRSAKNNKPFVVEMRDGSNFRLTPLGQKIIIETYLGLNERNRKVMTEALLESTERMRGILQFGSKLVESKKVQSR